MTDDLRVANDEWNNAWLAKDAVAVERMAAEGYRYIGPHGQLLDRTALLEIIRSPSYHLHSGNWIEMSIIRLSAESAVVLDRFQGDGEYQGQAFREDHRKTAVWVFRSGIWQVLLEHCSAITAG